MHDIHGHMISCETEDTVGCLGCLHFYVYFVSHQATTCVCVCVKHCQLKWLICRHIKTIHAQENSFWKAVQCSDHYVWKSHKRDCIFLKVVAYSLKTNQCFKIRIPFIHSSIHPFVVFFKIIYRISSFFNTMCLCLGGTYLGGSFWLIQSFTEHSCFLMICSHQTNLFHLIFCSVTCCTSLVTSSHSANLSPWYIVRVLVCVRLAHF